MYVITVIFVWCHILRRMLNERISISQWHTCNCRRSTVRVNFESRLEPWIKLCSKLTEGYWLTQTEDYCYLKLTSVKLVRRHKTLYIVRLTLSRMPPDQQNKIVKNQHMEKCTKSILKVEIFIIYQDIINMLYTSNDWFCSIHSNIFTAWLIQ
jgi:hypothetical protein